MTPNTDDAFIEFLRRHQKPQPPPLTPEQNQLLAFACVREAERRKAAKRAYARRLRILVVVLALLTAVVAALWQVLSLRMPGNVQQAPQVTPPEAPETMPPEEEPVFPYRPAMPQFESAQILGQENLAGDLKNLRLFGFPVNSHVGLVEWYQGYHRLLTPTDEEQFAIPSGTEIVLNSVPLARAKSTSKQILVFWTDKPANAKIAELANAGLLPQEKCSTPNALLVLVRPLLSGAGITVLAAKTIDLPPLNQTVEQRP